MSYKTLLLTSCIFVLIIVSCGYQGKYLLGDSTYMDDVLIGRWRAESDNDSKVSFKIIKNDKMNCYTAFFEDNIKHESKIIVERIFVTKILNTYILNLFYSDSSKAFYYYYKYSFKDRNTISIANMSEKFLAGQRLQSASQFRTFVSENINNDKLWGKETNFKRIVPITHAIDQSPITVSPYNEQQANQKNTEISNALKIGGAVLAVWMLSEILSGESGKSGNKVEGSKTCSKCDGKGKVKCDDPCHRYTGDYGCTGHRDCEFKENFFGSMSGSGEGNYFKPCDRCGGSGKE